MPPQVSPLQGSLLCSFPGCSAPLDYYISLCHKAREAGPKVPVCIVHAYLAWLVVEGTGPEADTVRQRIWG